MSNGFHSVRDAPNTVASFSKSILPLRPPPDMATIFAWGEVARKSRISSSPSRSGMKMSTITTSPPCSWCNRRPASPSPASRTSYPARSRIRRTALRSVASSSITRMRGTGMMRVQLSRAVSNLAAPRELGDVLAGAVGQGLNRRGRLAPAARDEARAVADEEVPHVVRAVVAVDDRGPRVVAHAARAQEVGREVRLLHRLPPGPPGARGLENLDRPVLQEAHHRQVVRVVPVSDPHGRQPPR